VDKNKKRKRTISAAVEILGGDASVEPEDENGELRPGNGKGLNGVDYVRTCPFPEWTRPKSSLFRPFY
jgi:hypothetical protein